MRILSHRGWWATAQEKNTEEAFVRSFQAGFGTETDLRDHGGDVVIAHDPPSFGTTSPMPLHRFLELHAAIEPSLPLALNIKADGLQSRVRHWLEHHAVPEAFVFDMAVPDALHYLRIGLTTFTRHSEVEPRPAFYEQSHGVWVDGFDGEWYSEAEIAAHLANGKHVCLVSPELHRRDPAPLWRALRDWRCTDDARLMLCTDHPDRAQEVLCGAD